MKSNKIFKVLGQAFDGSWVAYDVSQYANTAIDMAKGCHIKFPGTKFVVQEIVETTIYTINGDEDE